MRFDLDGHEADHVFRDRHLPLHFLDGCCRGVDVEQRVVRLAVLLDPEGQGLEPPVFGLGHLAAIAGDQGLVLLRQGIDLRGGSVLTGQEHMLVKSHFAICLSLRFQALDIRRRASFEP